MTFLKMTQTYSRIVAALSISMLLVACGGGGGSSSTPGVTSLLITLTAPNDFNSAATLAMGTNSQGAWQGSFSAGTSTALFKNILTDPIVSATVESSNSPATAILTLTASGVTFGTTGTITQNQYDTLKAAGTTLIVRIVTANTANTTYTTYTAALTQS